MNNMHINRPRADNQGFNQNYAGSAPPNHYGFGYDERSAGGGGGGGYNRPVPQINPYGISPVS